MKIKVFIALFSLVLVGAVNAQSSPVIKKTHQMKLKEAYEKVRKSRNLFKESDFHGFRSNRRRVQSIEKLNSQIDTNKQVSFQQSISNFIKVSTVRYHRFKNNILAKLWPPTNKHRTGSSPYAGGIFHQIISDGDRSIVNISTNEAITDDDGTVTSVVWKFGDGTTQTFNGDFLDDYGSVSHVYPEPGHYSITLQLFDNDLNITSYQTYVSIVNNQLPSPVFTVDTNSGSSPLSVSFTRTGEDPEGLLNQVRWKFGDGNSANSVDNTSEFNEYTSSGTYTVKLIMRDVHRGTQSTTAQIFVDDTPPAWGSNPSIVMHSTNRIGKAPHTVYFDASKSFDIDGTIASYEWDFGDYDSLSNFSDSATPNHRFNAPGTYIIKLTVTDAAGGESEKYFNVYVEGDTALAPRIFAHQNGSDRTIEFDNSLTSLRSAVEFNNYIWDSGDSATDVDNYFSHTYSGDGTYTATVGAYDVFGNYVEGSKEFTVTAGNDAPSASLQSPWQPKQIFTDFTFNASNSSDPQQSLSLTYFYDTGDGTYVESSSSSYTHNYQQNGYYRSRLFVTNTRGLSSSRSRPVKMNEGDTPVADIQYSPKVGAKSLVVDFDASNSFAFDSDIVKYYWLTPSGTFEDDHTFSYTFDNEGEYYLSVLVEDELGNVDIKDAKVFVYDAAAIPGGNQDPIADIDYSVDGGNSMLYHFDGVTGSSEPDSDSVVYAWTVNGTSVGDAYGYLDYEFEDKNFYTVELTVYDEWGASDSYSVQIDLSADVLDELKFDHYPLNPIAGQSVKFGGDKISIPGSVITNWSWDFGDTNSDTGSVVDHTYASAGTYTVTLTLTDDSSNTFDIEEDVTVDAAATNPNLTLVAQDIDLVSKTTNSGTYNGTSFPETVHFTVRPTSDSNTHIESATWTFGDGNTGFGPDVTYTYTRPGSYSVNVTGYDSNGNSNTASMTVVVPNDCLKIEGQTDCLDIKSQDDHFLGFSQANWVLERTGNFSTNSLYRPEDWIVLKALDGSEKEISLADVVSVSNNEITIDRESLKIKRIDFSKPYQILVNTKDASTDPVQTLLPQVWFAPGRLNITSNEQDMTVTITHPGSGFVKMIDMGSSTAITVADLPLGEISVVAKKGSYYESFSPTIGLFMAGNVDADTSSIRKLASEKGEKSYSIIDRIISRENSIKAKSNPKEYRSTLPASSYSLCGEAAPFIATSVRKISEGMESTWAFSSWAPTAQSTYRSIPQNVTKPVRLSCAVATESLLYSYNRWKYKDGPHRCFDEKEAHWYWNQYLETLNYRDSIAKIFYEVEDQWNSESYNHTISISPQSLIQMYGGIKNISQHVGYPTSDDQDWSLRQEFDLHIPPHFKRPRIRFAMESANSQAQGDLFEVECDVLQSEDYDPKVIGLSVASLNNASSRSERNAQYTLQGRYNMFPIHYENSATSAINIDSNAGKAKYLAHIRYYNQSSITWDGVNVDFHYDNQSHSESYSLTGTPVVDENEGIVTLAFEIDTADLASEFQWVEGVNKISLKVEPTGEDAASQPVTGLPFEKDFIALFDLQTVETDLVETICENGYFGSSYTTFVQDSLVSALRDANGDGVDMRCGSGSLPFGGPMDITGLEKNDHQRGLTLSGRSFNGTSGTQDSYDTSSAAVRVSDLDAYKTFSDAALTISQIVSETEMGNPTDKKKIYDYCRPSGMDPLFPCDENTTFSDIDHDMVLQICQWYSASGSEIDGCPADYLDEVIRFSSWLEYNTGALSLLSDLSVGATVSTGLHFDSTTYLQEQKNALVYGVWPDGKPVWAVSGTGNELTNSKVIECHDSVDGCAFLKQSTTDNNMNPSETEFSHQWRL